MTKTITTIHHHYTFGKAGFETSQQTRMTLAKLNNFNYLHLITSPQPQDYKSKFKNIGFDYGDIQSLDEYLFQTNATKIDKFFYKYFDKHGREIGSATYAETASKIPMWIYRFNNESYTEEDLIIKYLTTTTNPKNHILFRDDSRLQMPKLVRFTNTFNYKYFEYIHHNVLSDGYLPTLSKKINYLVANEEMALDLQTLGFKSTFLPPMCIFEESLISKKIKSIKKYIWSAHLGEYKNFKLALQIMKDLENTGITLDVYGGTKDNFDSICKSINCYPKNVNYIGLVNTVPYQNYDGYLSTSNHEVFSNACVEAMSYGLKCIVSNLKCPYQFYSNMTHHEVEIAHNKDDYVNLLLENSKKEFISNYQFTFLKRYSYENWAPLFKELVD